MSCKRTHKRSTWGVAYSLDACMRQSCPLTKPVFMPAGKGIARGRARQLLAAAQTNNAGLLERERGVGFIQEGGHDL